MLRFEFKFGTIRWFYPIIFVSCGESQLLLLWCAGGRCDMIGNDEDLGRSRRPGVEDQGCSSIGRVLSNRMIERSDDTVCGLYCVQGDEHRFFG
jgi:hypothetical protein